MLLAQPQTVASKKLKELLALPVNQRLGHLLSPQSSSDINALGPREFTDLMLPCFEELQPRARLTGFKSLRDSSAAQTLAATNPQEYIDLMVQVIQKLPTRARLAAFKFLRDSSAAQTLAATNPEKYVSNTVRGIGSLPEKNRLAELISLHASPTAKVLAQANPDAYIRFMMWGGQVLPPSARLAGLESLHTSSTVQTLAQENPDKYVFLMVWGIRDLPTADQKKFEQTSFLRCVKGQNDPEKGSQAHIEYKDCVLPAGTSIRIMTELKSSTPEQLSAAWEMQAGPDRRNMRAHLSKTLRGLGSTFKAAANKDGTNADERTRLDALRRAAIAGARVIGKGRHGPTPVASI